MLHVRILDDRIPRMLASRSRLQKDVSMHVLLCGMHAVYIVLSTHAHPASLPTPTDASLQRGLGSVALVAVIRRYIPAGSCHHGAGRPRKPHRHRAPGLDRKSSSLPDGTLAPLLSAEHAWRLSSRPSGSLVMIPRVVRRVCVCVRVCWFFSF